MSRFAVVPMESWDLLAVTPMLKAWHQEQPATPPLPDDHHLRLQGWLLDRLGSPELGAFVIRDGAKAKGMTWGVLGHHDNNDGGMVLDWRAIYVQPHFRGRGFGHRMLTALLQWGRERAPGCVLEWFADGDAANHWASAGAVEVSRRFAWVDADGAPKAGLPLAPPAPRRNSGVGG